MHIDVDSHYFKQLQGKPKVVEDNGKSEEQVANKQ